jgi:C-terminal processing protease CtpA/Prc
MFFLFCFFPVLILNHHLNSTNLNNTKGSLNSCSTSLNTNQVSHPETVEINLKADEHGTFGFTLQGAGIVMTSNHMNEVVQNIVPFPVIGYVEPNSAAEKCGIMQPGDRIILVNNRSLEGLSLEDARQIIKEAGANLQLEIEFDVQDAIMLTSGIFQVKILKKNLELGLVVAYPRYWKTENYPYISEIRKGSAAYRSGMLQPGDRILFIDNSSLRNRSVHEINSLLKSTDEIVKLKIKKDEVYTEDNADNVVVYTVEMQRNGGPLGITISGSDDLFEPMFVSGLTEGGLAERTNAIHVGDVILAINNVPLRGKTLTEAIELLQNADDAVTLKISRKLDKNSAANSSNGSSYQLSAHQAFRPREREEKVGQFMSESSESNNETTSSSNCSNQKSIQYLPFPMDMTHFIRQSHTNSPSSSSNGGGGGTLKSSHAFSMEEMKRKAASLDSINAVERELDEVLKDLELNSQDLNEQLEENEYLTASTITNNNNSNSVEVPISIQKSGGKIESSSSSSNSCSSPSLNKSFSSGASYGEKTRAKPSSLLNSEFLRTTCELFIDDVDDRESQAKKCQEKATTPSGAQNGNRKRQNIISTYELCNECFDNSLIMSNTENCSSKCCAKRYVFISC